MRHSSGLRLRPIAPVAVELANVSESRLVGGWETGATRSALGW